MNQFDQRFPHTEFECLIGEEEDVIDLLQKSRAQVGLTEARDSYPTDIGFTRLPIQTRMAIYVATNHPLAGQQEIQPMSCTAGGNCGSAPIWSGRQRSHADPSGRHPTTCYC